MNTEQKAYIVERYEKGNIIYYCSECNKELGWQHEFGGGMPKASCSHFEWRTYGNLYYEMNAEKINRRAILRIWSGTSIYVLYPKVQ